LQRDICDFPFLKIVFFSDSFSGIVTSLATDFLIDAEYGLTEEQKENFSSNNDEVTAASLARQVVQREATAMAKKIGQTVANKITSVASDDRNVCWSKAMEVACAEKRIEISAQEARNVIGSVRNGKYSLLF
jgi:hypothetical protein